MQHQAGVPVAIALEGPLQHEVRAYLESEAGWHVVDVDGPVRPVLRVVSEPCDAACVVVASAPVPPQRVREALARGALDVVAWPDERARLLTAPARVPPPSALGRAVPLLRIGACRGGVGASTVALAAGALVAWSGRSALVVTDDAGVMLAGLGRWTGAGAVELAALGPQAADEVAHVARPVPAVQGLHVVGGGAVDMATNGWPYDIVVVDMGRAGRNDADLLVGAADGSLRAAPAGADVLVVTHGPLDRAGVRRHLGRDPAGWLPFSARVARAGVAGRVPSSLPGTWVHALRRALAQAGRQPVRRAGG
jgi:hypothetical protein